MTVDIKDFYLNTPMDTYEYMCIPVKDIPDTIMHLVHNDYVCVEALEKRSGLCLSLVLESEHAADFRVSLYLEYIGRESNDYG
jgi:hypothetical protein